MEPRRSVEETTTADRLAARLVEGLPVTTRRLDLAGVSTSLLEGGEDPPIVVLHGQGGFAEIMGGLIASLVDRFRVIAPDLPGLGRSVVQDGTLDAPGVVKWLGELISKTCDQPPILLGVSMGGSIAARFTVQRGDEVSKVILVNSGSLGRFRPPPSLLFALIRLIRKPDRAGVQRMQRQIFHNADRVRAQMGDRLTALEDYQIDRAKQPTVNAANRALLRKMGTKPIPDEELEKIEVDGHGSLYEPTPAGRDLATVLNALGGWAEKWTELTSQHAAPDYVLWSWCKNYLRHDLLPDERVVVRFEFHQRNRRINHRLLIGKHDAEVCRIDPGFGDDVVVVVTEPLAFAQWHMGIVNWPSALRSGGIKVNGNRDLCRALPTWNGAPAIISARRARLKDKVDDASVG